MKITKKKEVELARKFFDEVMGEVEDGDDFIYEALDPDFKFGDSLCEVLNNDVVREVLSLGFKAKYGEEWHRAKTV